MASKREGFPANKLPRATERFEEREEVVDLDALVEQYEAIASGEGPRMTARERKMEAERLLGLLDKARTQTKLKSSPQQMEDLVHISTLADRINASKPAAPSRPIEESVPQAAQQMQAMPEEPKSGSDVDVSSTANPYRASNVSKQMQEEMDAYANPPWIDAEESKKKNNVQSVKIADVEARIAESGVAVPEFSEVPIEQSEPSTPPVEGVIGDKGENKVEQIAIADVEARIAAGSETPVDLANMTPREQKERLKQLVNAEEFVRGMQTFADADQGITVGNESGFTDKRKIESVVAGVATEKTAMQEAESAYLSAYKNFYASKGVVSRAKQSVFGGREMEELEQLKGAYDAKRVEYARALEQSVGERLSARGVDAERQARVLERYNRLVRFNEVVRPGAEKRLAVRVEALDAKGKNAVEKSLNWLVMSNLKLDKRYGTYGARAIRAATAAVVLTGGSAALGVGAAAGAASLAGLGSIRFLQSFVAGSVAAGGAQFFGNLYRDTRGRDVMERSGQKLKTEGRGGKDSLTREGLADIDRKRGALMANADERTLAKKTAGVKFLVGLGLGAELATVAAEVLAASPEAAVPEPTAPQEMGADAPRPTAVPPPAETITARSGEGGIKLFARLQESVRADYPNGSDNPAIQHIIDSNPETLAKEYGFYKPGVVAESALVEKGSVLGFMPDGTLTYQAGADGVVETLSPGRVFDSYVDTNAPNEESAPEPMAQDSKPETSGIPNPPLPPEELPESVPTPEPAPKVQPEAARAPIPENLRINAHGAEIDPDHAGLFQDETGARKILHGGTLEERAELAQKVIEKDHSAVVYFDSSKTGFLGLRTFHLTKGVWDSETGTVLLRDETADPSLRGMRLPTEADLYPLTSEKK